MIALLSLGIVRRLREGEQCERERGWDWRRRSLCRSWWQGAAAPVNARNRSPMDATLREVQKALTALPRDNILHQVMADYETERDDLRFCH